MLMWVKSHSRVARNEEADSRAKKEVEMGWHIQQLDIVTPAGIRQAHPLHPKAPAHLFALVHQSDQRPSLYSDGQGPSKTVALGDRKSRRLALVCDGCTAQNAAHLQQCRGWEMEWADWRSRYGITRNGARGWWNSLCREGRGTLGLV